jgi:hypothetical protein
MNNSKFPHVTLSVHKVKNGAQRVDWGEKERMVALRPHTPKHIRGAWPHYTDTSEPVEVMGLKIWSLSNPGLKPATFRSLAQRANHCANWAHQIEVSVHLKPHLQAPVLPWAELTHDRVIMIIYNALLYWSETKTMNSGRLLCCRSTTNVWPRQDQTEPLTGQHSITCGFYPPRQTKQDLNYKRFTFVLVCTFILFNGCIRRIMLDANSFYILTDSARKKIMQIYLTCVWFDWHSLNYYPCPWTILVFSIHPSWSLGTKLLWFGLMLTHRLRPFWPHKAVREVLKSPQDHTAIGLMWKARKRRCDTSIFKPKWNCLKLRLSWKKNWRLH